MKIPSNHEKQMAFDPYPAGDHSGRRLPLIRLRLPHALRLFLQHKDQRRINGIPAEPAAVYRQSAGQSFVYRQADPEATRFHGVSPGVYRDSRLQQLPV